MANKTNIVLSKDKAAKVREEIQEKIKHYESRMGYRLQRWVEAAEMWSGRSFERRENAKVSPCSAELFKAIRAQANMIVRMLTGQKPFFELECLDAIGYDDPYKLLKSEHYATNQLDLSNFNKGLYRTVTQLLLYGSVAIHKPYESIRWPFMGRKQWITQFRAVSLLNCAFALDSYDIAESGWVAFNDIQSKGELEKLLRADEKGVMYDRNQIKAAQAQSEYIPQVNEWVRQRMAAQGYIDQEFRNGMERTTYYGPLDCMNSNDEFCVEIVNRDFIIRMEQYDGIRPVSVDTVNTIDIDPMGNGLYDQFGPILKTIDESELSLANQIYFAGLNMFRMQKDLTDEDQEFVMRQHGIVRSNNPLEPLGPNPNNITAVAGYTADRVQKFRTASGAPDTLQAIVTNEQITATATSLSMNEAVRNLSVQAEMLAPNLVRDHIKIIFQNAQKYQTEPFVLNINGAPVNTMPSDLWIDVNVRVKTATDQDFGMAKMQKLREAVMIMGTVPPPPGKKWNPGPSVEEMLKMLNVPKWKESVQDLTEEDYANMALMNQIGGNPNAPKGGSGMASGGSEVAEGTISTPVGPVLTAPGSEAETMEAVESANKG